MFDLTPIEIPDLSGKTILITGAGRGIGAVLGHGDDSTVGIHNDRFGT